MKKKIIKLGLATIAAAYSISLASCNVNVNVNVEETKENKESNIGANETETKENKESNIGTNETETTENKNEDIQTECTVNFFNDKGKVVDFDTIPYNTKISPRTLNKREGYVFAGWYINLSDEEPFNFDTPITKDLDLHAKYKKIITVNYLLDNNVIQTVNCLEGDKLESINIPYKHKKTAYWANKENEKFDFDTILSDNLDLHAMYLDFDTSNLKKNFVDGNMSDFSKYEGTSAYVKVSNVNELIDALVNARDEYKTTWDDEKNDYTQEMEKEGSVSVIEITNDINLGYNFVSKEHKALMGFVEDYNRKNRIQDTSKSGIASQMLLDNGISKIKIEKTNGLKIYSKNGAKLTHGGFSIGSSSDIEFENIKMDEMWQWEDSDTFSPNFTVGDYDVYGWAYFKISNSNNIYIHDCSFGKSYDGQIDISDSNYWHHKELAELRAPYGTAREANYTISRCNFDAGSKDESGYIYKMMQDIENDYVSNGKESKYKYYYTLRNDYNLSFEDILNAIALPQKKGFLLGDRSEYGEEINYYAHINFDSCKFTNIEDRLPKVRSGFVYMSNCIFDNSLYMKTHLNLTKDEKNSVKNINLKYKKFKCALTSQGLVISQNGDVIAENCIFIGIKELVKNNEGDGSLGGFMLVNCKYDQKADGSIVKLDTSLNYDSFKVNSVSNIEFNYHNENNIQEIQPEIIDLKL